MFYRSSNKAVLAVLIAATLGTFAPARADDSASDLDKQIKEKQAQLEELEEKVKSPQAKAAMDAKKIAAGAREQAEKLKQSIDLKEFGFAPGGAPIRVRVQTGLTDAIHAAAAEVRDAKGEDERKAAQKKLDEALGKYFDEDMVQREKELKQVEERVTKLHDLLEKRRSNKQEIIDLESKVVLNQANGLGFYDNDEPGGGGFGGLFRTGPPFSIKSDGRGWSTSYVPKVMAVPPAPSKPAPPADSPEKP